jgi:nitrogen fixation protein NifU and related proteins
MYSAQVLDHFERPRNVGDVPEADASAQLENPACGDILRLSVKIANERVADVRFRAKGCVPAIACASLLTELVRGRTLAETKMLRREELLEAIGGLPQESMHASHLAIDTLAAVFKVIGNSSQKAVDKSL